MGKIMHFNDEWSNLIFDLRSHAYLVALENIGHVTTNVHQLSN
jgi:hypothetical protein